jgi:hypothetical protein
MYASGKSFSDLGAAWGIAGRIGDTVSSSKPTSKKPAPDLRARQEIGELEL